MTATNALSIVTVLALGLAVAMRSRSGGLTSGRAQWLLWSAFAVSLVVRWVDPVVVAGVQVACLLSAAALSWRVWTRPAPRGPAET